MLYNNFTITVAQRQESGYPVSALADGIGRASNIAPLPTTEMEEQIRQITTLLPHPDVPAVLRSVGETLFHWLIRGSLEPHLRVAWDRASRAGRGLRLRLSIDAPEINAWPWELLYDPARDHAFASAISTPLVRYLDQAAPFGGLVEQAAELPLDLLLVIPTIPDLDLLQERTLIAQATMSLGEALNLHVLDGIVELTSLSDTLLAKRYDIVHFSGHGGHSDGQGYIGLNTRDGQISWTSGRVLSQLLANHKSLKLVVLNTCSGGQVDDSKAFRGLAPQLVRQGIPAVVAMQYPLTDQAAMTFAREFYRQLCTGENAGQVDVAITHARNMLNILYPDERYYAAPVLYTHAADSVIYTLTREPDVQAILAPSSRQARLAMFTSSLQTSTDFADDWAMADASQLQAWQRTLEQAEQAYRTHLTNEDPDIQQAAHLGLASVQARLTMLKSALSTMETA